MELVLFVVGQVVVGCIGYCGWWVYKHVRELTGDVNLLRGFNGLNEAHINQELNNINRHETVLIEMRREQQELRTNIEILHDVLARAKENGKVVKDSVYNLETKIKELEYNIKTTIDYINVLRDVADDQQATISEHANAIDDLDEQVDEHDGLFVTHCQAINKVQDIAECKEGQVSEIEQSLLNHRVMIEDIRKRMDTRKR